jgi:metallophosphoesterase superfamily enzyme
MNDVLKRLDGETENQMLWRLGRAKTAGILGAITWPEVAAVMNKEFRDGEENYFDSSAYRKRYKNFSDAYEELFSKENFASEEIVSLVEHKRELEKAKIKLRDERIDYQKSLREDARRESFIELVERAMASNVEPFDYKPSRISHYTDSDDMVVCLSDLHAGIEVQNWWNTYDVKILKSRLHRYLDEIVRIQHTHRCNTCHLVLGGDNISGLIHSNLRLQNNENVVEQLKIAVTYIGEFINALQVFFDEIKVHSVSGNHSRLNPNKDDHLKGEELDDMIPFCLSLQFATNDKVKICDGYAEKIDSTISAFVTTGGRRFYIVHGDKDAPSNVVKNLTLISGTKPDGIIMGHRHHNALDTEHNVKIIQCGCVVGMDDYCVDKRISGEPEQCVFITSKDRTVKCLYDIGLN